ncbi:hypothetical protein BU24DRAFT_25874 [Aaosphaeria arxii CBS 175.79]|uniref:F-box domain-containing protein n=1 Tax=Aaosphaeria arxii CBS 175.79 TaxID=1450172 RepID=A0A6A5YAB6_9PLEO|nr:uncharacterized protein BU24DRAFT_25874 [Aaosphaeria arxii CBS 175.79]KAF2021701.1 hypothetical protein BU24DRAFT_25874 [Aaosphaeria arxii CBS 175.79]
MQLNDPENFLNRCSGFRGKTLVRCNHSIRKIARYHPRMIFLPTCKQHRDQKFHAGRCQHVYADDSRCGRLFRWQPNYFEMCEEHKGLPPPGNPCYITRLPLELHQAIWSHLLPSEAVSSALIFSHRLDRVTREPMDSPSVLPNPERSSGSNAVRRGASHPGKLFPMPLQDLLLASRQWYNGVKSLLFSTTAFTIDIRHDGAFICGRRILQPKREDGSIQLCKEPETKRFVNSFPFEFVKHWNVDILLENYEAPTKHDLDEEVEMYDVRAYVSVTVEGILARSQDLCKLHVRIGMSSSRRTPEQIVEATKVLVAPFDRLRNVHQPRLCGVYHGFLKKNHMICVPYQARPNPRGMIRDGLFSVCPLRVDRILLDPQNASFKELKRRFETLVSSSAEMPSPESFAIRDMFKKFRRFYASLSGLVPGIGGRSSRIEYLHSARKARANEDLETFREVRAKLIQCWHDYLQVHDTKRRSVNHEVTAMLVADVYPNSLGDPSLRRNPTPDEAVTHMPESAFFAWSPYGQPPFPESQSGSAGNLLVAATHIQPPGYIQHSPPLAEMQAYSGQLATLEPTLEPMFDPRSEPMVYPTIEPTFYPVTEPIFDSMSGPMVYPTIEPIFYPATQPMFDPVSEPMSGPMLQPTLEPTMDPYLLNQQEPSEPTIDPYLLNQQEPSEPTIDPYLLNQQEPLEPTVNPYVLNQQPLEPTMNPYVLNQQQPLEPTMNPYVLNQQQPLEQLNLEHATGLEGPPRLLSPFRPRWAPPVAMQPAHSATGLDAFPGRKRSLDAMDSPWTQFNGPIPSLTSSPYDWNAAVPDSPNKRQRLEPAPSFPPLYEGYQPNPLPSDHRDEE